MRRIYRPQRVGKDLESDIASFCVMIDGVETICMMPDHIDSDRLAGKYFVEE